MNPYLKKSGLLIRLLAIFYDLSLLVGVLFLFGLIFALFDRDLLFSDHQLHWIYQVYINGVVFGYYFFFLKRNHQTPGMKVCRLYLLDGNQKIVQPKKIAIRWVIAYLSILCFGLGFFIAIFSAEKKTLYDRLTQSYIYKLERKKNLNQ